jgi:hypothetical protein
MDETKMAGCETWAGFRLERGLDAPRSGCVSLDARRGIQSASPRRASRQAPHPRRAPRQARQL